MAKKKTKNKKSKKNESNSNDGWKNKELVKVYFCPKCNSTNVFHPFKLGNLFGVFPKWECKDCGYVAGLFPILNIEKDKLVKMVRTR